MTFLHAIEITPQKASPLTYGSSFLSTNLELQRCVAALILINPSQRDDGAPRIPITFLIFSYLTFLSIFFNAFSKVNCYLIKKHKGYL